MLFGEYGVIDGGPALLAAVNRRALVTLELAERYTVSAPGWLPQDVFFDWPTGNDQPIWQDVTPSVAERLTLLDALLAHYPDKPLTPVKFTLNTQAFFSGTKKLGLGSSAALCVALTGALTQQLGRQATLADCQQVHFTFQGSGSGADVAACYQGGVVSFQLSPALLPASLPAGLELAFIWTNLSASTQDMLSALADHKQHQPASYRQSMQALQTAAMLILQQADLDCWLAAVAGFIAALKQFATQTSLPIFCSPHGELVTLAKEQGMLYKPMGAGGGDLGVAMATNQPALQAFCAQATSLGLPAIPLTIDPVGLKLS